MNQITIVLGFLMIPLFFFMIAMPRMTLANLKYGVVKHVKTNRFYLKAGIYLLLAVYLLFKNPADIRVIVIACCLLFLTFWYLYHAYLISKLNLKNQQDDTPDTDMP